MKRVAVTLSILAAASGACAVDGVSPERGRELFTGKALGTNGKSCSSCHPGGTGLEKAAAYDESELQEIINQCIRKPLRGKGLDPASAEMKSLISYIKTLSPSATAR